MLLRVAGGSSANKKLRIDNFRIVRHVEIKRMFIASSIHGSVQQTDVWEHSVKEKNDSS
jgi:hypothetical protein